MTIRSTPETLRGTKSVLERNGWIRGQYADLSGVAGGKHPMDCPVCLVGAVNVAEGRYPDDCDFVSDAMDAIQEALGLVDLDPVPAWNDEPGRTVDEVLALLDKAIEIAEDWR